MIPIKYRIDRLIGAWIDLICSLIAVLTCSYWYPSWYMTVRCNIARKRLKERKRENVR